MSFLSSLGKFIGGFLFFLSLNALIFSIVMSEFLQYSNIQPAIGDLIEKQIVANVTQRQLELLHADLIAECNKSATGSLPVSLSETKNITVNCSEISEKRASDLPKIFSKGLFDEIYYKKYYCGFVQCLLGGDLKEKGFVLLNMKAYETFKTAIIYSMIGVGVSFVILFISIKNLYRVLRNIGTSCLVTGIPFFILFYYKEPVIERLVSVQSPEIVRILANVFESTAYLLFIVFISGIILTIIGFVGSRMKRIEGKKK